MNAHPSLWIILAGCLLAGTATAQGIPAKLVDAAWNAAAELPPNSELGEEDRVLTTRFGDPETELVAHGTLTYDISRGRDGILQFLSTHSWMRCEAPEGLEVGDSGQVSFVCRPEASGLARLKRKTKITIKADPPGGGRHKKVFWVLLPEK